MRELMREPVSQSVSQFIKWREPALQLIMKRRTGDKNRVTDCGAKKKNEEVATVEPCCFYNLSQFLLALTESNRSAGERTVTS
jgi:hypothetical protein